MGVGCRSMIIITIMTKKGGNYYAYLLYLTYP